MTVLFSLNVMEAADIQTHSGPITGEIVELPEHQAVILSLAQSADGRLIATGSNDRNILLWDRRSGKELFRLKGGASGISALAFSRNGKQLVSGSRDRDIVLWDCETGTELHRFPDHKGVVTTLSLDRSGNLLAFGLDNGRAGIWNVKDKKPQHALNRHQRSILALCFSHKEPKLALASQDKTVSIWDTKTGKQLHHLQEHRGPVNCLAFDPTGQKLASGSSDRSILLWNVADGTQTLRLTGHSEQVTWVAFAMDGQTLYSTSRDGMCIQWELAKGTPLVQCRFDRPIHLAACNASGFQMVTVGLDNKAVTFPTDALYFKQPNHQKPVKRGPWEKLAQEKPLLRWNPKRTPEQEEAALSKEPVGNHIDFHPNGPFIASVDNSPTGTVWDIEQNLTVYSFTHKSPMVSVFFSPKGRLLVAGDRVGGIVTINPKDGRIQESARGHTGPINAIAFSPDEQLILTGSSDKNIISWSLGPLRSTRIFSGHSASVTGLAVLPQGHKALSVSRDGTVRHWNADGTCTKTFPFPPQTPSKTDQKNVPESSSTPPSLPLLSLAVHPKGTLYATGTETGFVGVFHTETDEQVALFKYADSPPDTLAFSPDGSVLAVGGRAGTTVFYDTKTYEPFHAFPQIPQKIESGIEWVTQQREKRNKWIHPPAEFDNEPIVSLVFQNQGPLLATSGGVQTYFWKVDSIRPPVETIRTKTPPVVSEPVQESSFSMLDIPLVQAIRRFEPVRPPVLSASLTRDGTKIAISTENKQVQIFDTTSEKPISTFHPRSPLEVIRFLPDHRTILAGSQDCRFFSINTLDGKTLFHKKVHTDRVTLLAVSDNGARVLSGSDDRMAVLWDSRRGENQGRLTEHKQPLIDLALSRDGSKALTVSEDKRTILWDTRNLAPIPFSEEPVLDARAVAFSPDGKNFALAQKNTIIRYQSATGKEIDRIDQPGISITRITYTIDEHHLVTACEDGNALLWNLTEKRPLRRFQAAALPIREVTPSYDGKQFLLVDPKGVGYFPTSD